MLLMQLGPYGQEQPTLDEITAPSTTTEMMLQHLVIMEIT